MAEIHLNIYGFIGKSWFEDEQIVNLEDIKKETESVSEGDEIIQHINSGGGETFEGFAIHDYLDSLPVKITSIIEGLAGSMATIIALVADNVKMMPNAMFFVHKPSGAGFGEEEDVRSVADLLANTTELAIDIYQKKTGKDRETIESWLTENKFFTAKEALEVGLIDEIIEPAEAIGEDGAATMRNIRPAVFMDLNFVKRNKINLMAKNQKTKWPNLAKLLNIETKAKLEITLATDKEGEPLIMEVETEAQEVEVGDEIKIDGAKPEDGDYVGKDGETYSVEDGVVTGIKPSEEEEELGEGSEEELAEVVTAAIQKETKTILASLKKVQTGMKTVTTLQKKIKEQEDQIKELTGVVAEIGRNLESEGFEISTPSGEFEDDDDRNRKRAKTVSMKDSVIARLQAEKEEKKKTKEA